MKSWKIIGPIIIVVMLSGLLLGASCSSKGEAGVGIENAVNNGDGTFTLNFSDGTSFTTSDLTGPQGEQGPQGTAGGAMAWQGAWAVSIPYSVNDAVEDDGSSYICIQGHTSSAGDEPGTGGDWETYWDLFAQSGYSEDISQIIDEIGILQDTTDDIQNDVATLQDSVDSLSNSAIIMESDAGVHDITTSVEETVVPTQTYDEVAHVTLTAYMEGIMSAGDMVWVELSWEGGVYNPEIILVNSSSSIYKGTVEFAAKEWALKCLDDDMWLDVYWAYTVTYPAS